MSNIKSLHTFTRTKLPESGSKLISSQIEKLLPGASARSANNSDKLNSREFNLMNDLIKSIGHYSNVDTTNPEALLRLVSSIYRGSYVQLPNHLGNHVNLGQLNQLRDLLNRWFNTSGPNFSDPNLATRLLPEDTLYKSRIHDGVTNLPISDAPGINESEYLNSVKIPGSNVFNNDAGYTIAKVPTEVARRYDWIYDDPYNSLNYIQFIDSNQLISELNDIYHYGIGPKYYQGFTIGSTTSWAIQLYPYKYYSNGPITGFPNNSSRYCLIKDLPKYYLPNLTDNKELGTGIEFSFSKYLPALSWSLSFGNFDTLEFDLFNGSSMSVPLGFKYQMQLTVEVVDDQYSSLDKYFRSYINTIYNQNTRSIAPYWASAFWIPVVLFREGYVVNYRFNLIGILTNFGTSLQAEDPGSESKVSLEFSVIGIQTYNNGEGKVYPGDVGANSLNNMGELTWNDITLRAN